MLLQCLCSADCSSPIHKLYKGTLRSDLCCLTCRTTSTKLESFFDISLHLRNRHVEVGGPELHTCPVCMPAGVEAGGYELQLADQACHGATDGLVWSVRTA